MLKWMINNPMKSIGVVLFGFPLMDRYLKQKARNELHTPVLKKLVSGSKPSIPVKDVMMQRQKISSDLAKMFLPEPIQKTEFIRFGVVIGPSGSGGKTTAIRQLCNNWPKGMLYYEISEPRTFVNALSTEIGMKTSPNTVLDLVLSQISISYCHYHQLPQNNPVAGLDMVLKVLSDVGQMYSIKYGEIPVLCIDGVDPITSMISLLYLCR